MRQPHSNATPNKGIAADIARLESLVADQIAGDPVPDSEIASASKQIIESAPAHMHAATWHLVRTFLAACLLHYRALYAPEHFADPVERSNEAHLSASRLSAARRTLLSFLQDVPGRSASLSSERSDIDRMEVAP